MIDRLRKEAGYSLVEVMASIVILTVAIIPMVAMFDVGLKSATLGSNYDMARALATKQLEKAQSSSYGSVRSNFPHDPARGVTCPSGAAPFNASNGRSTTTVCADSAYTGFTFDVEKQFLQPPDSGGNFTEDDEDMGLMRTTVTVRWENGPYRITTLKAR